MFLKELLNMPALRAPFFLNFIVNVLVLMFVIPMIFFDKSHLLRVPVDLQLEVS